MKRVTAILGLLFLVLCLLPNAVLSQDTEQATALFDEAKKPRDKVESKEDIQEALNKYQQTLKIFSPSGREIYHTRSQYKKASEFFEKPLAQNGAKPSQCILIERSI